MSQITNTELSIQSKTERVLWNPNQAGNCPLKKHWK